MDWIGLDLSVYAENSVYRMVGAKKAHAAPKPKTMDKREPLAAVNYPAKGAEQRAHIVQYIHKDAEEIHPGGHNFIFRRLDDKLRRSASKTRGVRTQDAPQRGPQANTTHTYEYPRMPSYTHKYLYIPSIRGSALMGLSMDYLGMRWYSLIWRRCRPYWFQ